eukprot:FR736687.1.p1 GENE.FR736687.1~~FR736687.1.p1  ORF type:complete len:138 (-),score=25.01 FR736687.1:291-704(-)
MTMITPSAQLTLTKGNKSWSSTAVAAALELVDPLAWTLAVTHCGRFFFFFFFFFFDLGQFYDGSRNKVPSASCVALVILSTQHQQGEARASIPEKPRRDVRRRPHGWSSEGRIGLRERPASLSFTHYWTAASPRPRI